MTSGDPLESCVALLHQGLDLLQRIGDEAYREARPGPRTAG